jgi:hypothetical protein
VSDWGIWVTLLLPNWEAKLENEFSGFYLDKERLKIKKKSSKMCRTSKDAAKQKKHYEPYKWNLMCR